MANNATSQRLSLAEIIASALVSPTTASGCDRSIPLISLSPVRPDLLDPDPLENTRLLSDQPLNIDSAEGIRNNPPISLTLLENDVPIDKIIEHPQFTASQSTTSSELPRRTDSERDRKHSHPKPDETPLPPPTTLKRSEIVEDPTPSKSNKSNIDDHISRQAQQVQKPVPTTDSKLKKSSISATDPRQADAGGIQTGLNVPTPAKIDASSSLPAKSGTNPADPVVVEVVPIQEGKTPPVAVSDHVVAQDATSDKPQAKLTADSKPHTMQDIKSEQAQSAQTAVFAQGESAAVVSNPGLPIEAPSSAPQEIPVQPPSSQLDRRTEAPNPASTTTPDVNLQQRNVASNQQPVLHQPSDTSTKTISPAKQIGTPGTPAKEMVKSVEKDPGATAVAPTAPSAEHPSVSSSTAADRAKIAPTAVSAARVSSPNTDKPKPRTMASGKVDPRPRTVRPSPLRPKAGDTMARSVPSPKPATSTVSTVQPPDPTDTKQVVAKESVDGTTAQAGDAITTAGLADEPNPTPMANTVPAPEASAKTSISDPTAPTRQVDTEAVKQGSEVLSNPATTGTAAGPTSVARKTTPTPPTVAKEVSDLRGTPPPDEPSVKPRVQGTASRPPVVEACARAAGPNVKPGTRVTRPTPLKNPAASSSPQSSPPEDKADTVGPKSEPDGLAVPKEQASAPKKIAARSQPPISQAPVVPEADITSAERTIPTVGPGRPATGVPGSDQVEATVLPKSMRSSTPLPVRTSRPQLKREITANTADETSKPLPQVPSMEPITQAGSPETVPLAANVSLNRRALASSREEHYDSNAAMENADELLYAPRPRFSLGLRSRQSTDLTTSQSTDGSDSGESVLRPRSSRLSSWWRRHIGRYRLPAAYPGPPMWGPIPPNFNMQVGPYQYMPATAPIALALGAQADGIAMATAALPGHGLPSLTPQVYYSNPYGPAYQNMQVFHQTMPAAPVRSVSGNNNADTVSASV